MMSALVAAAMTPVPFGAARLFAVHPEVPTDVDVGKAALSFERTVRYRFTADS